MKKLILAVALAVMVQASGFSQPVKAPTILPHSVVSNGARLQVPVAETVSEVVLESKPKGAKTWTARPTTLKNLPGNRRLIIDVPLTLRGQELRVTLRATRPAPQAVAFSPDKTKARMQVGAGLPAGTRLSAEYFDATAQQWKRFATVQAPKDTKKSWTVSVPAARRASQLRLTRMDGKIAGTQSAKFPAAFRTGKSKFAGKEITNSGGDGTILANTSAQLQSDSSAKSASPQIEESDIWKISGTKIYFFNQLRGLQVIETANAADPEIVSFLRMPAVGEDMYVLPGSRAVLVRRDWRNGGTTGVVLVDASLPQAKVMAELQVPGWYADSRLVNGRLVLATTQWDSASWQSSTTIRVIDNLAAAPRIAAEAMLDFSANAMGAGSEFLWVSGSKNWSWTQSSIALFPLDALPALGAPLRAELGGMIYDKFKVHQNGATLFAVTQSWGANWRQSTALESYSLETKPTLLQRLPLVEGESLHATRFDGNRAYVVTFEQIDPLWIIDLADPSAMRIESELQVPGWSTYIQPVGGYLAAVGVDAGKVTASLFDVRDPAKPTLSSRVDIGGSGYTWSEANWNEKAVAIIPESGLILLPFSSFNSEGDLSAVQLVDLNVKSGKLTKRGVIRHAFSPRRANALRAGILASISNRELLLLDAANRDKPAALAEVTLAFAADRILGSHNGLLVHAENGDWRGSAAMLRVSAATDPDAVAAEASLGDGDILAGALRGNHLVALLRSHKNPEEGRIVRFDAAQLPKLVETGRSTFKLTAAWNASSELVWPSENLAVAAVRRSNWGWWRGPWIQDAPMVSATAKMSISPGIYPPPYSFGEESVTLYAFDFSAALPRPASTFDLAAISPRNTSNFFAADGLVVFSSERAQEEKLPAGKTVPTPRLIGQTFLQVADYADPAAPSLWPEAALPGRLENITEFDRAAGLLFAANNDGGLEALLYEGGSAQSIAALPRSDLRSTEGRTVWTFSGKNLSRQRLGDNATWALEGSRTDLPFADPAALRAHAGGLLMRRGDEMASVPTVFSAPIRRLTIPGWSWWWTSDLSQAAIGTQTVAIPAGQYGIEVLR